MREYVTKEQVREVMAKYYENANLRQDHFLRRVYQEIKALPAADVVEVVRCRECKHYQTGMFCEKWADLHPHAEVYPMVSSNGYCHYGDRKDGADNGC